MLSIDLHMEFNGYHLHTATEIKKGEIVGLFGKSGIGKTTFLKVISGLYKPKRSKICFENSYWNHQDDKTFVPAQNRSVGMVFQDFALFPNLSVEDNLKFSQKISHHEMTELINTLGIDNILDQKPNSISGGQKQRVAIGRAIAYDPNILLMDEPFAALDEDIKETIKAFLKSYIKERNKIMIIASHDMDDLQYFDPRIIRLNEQGKD